MLPFVRVEHDASRFDVDGSKKLLRAMKQPEQIVGNARITNIDRFDRARTCGRYMKIPDGQVRENGALQVQVDFQMLAGGKAVE